MGWIKQLCWSSLVLSAAAACVSCQELTSTLRAGNRTCPGEEVIFTCTVRGTSTVPVLALAWSSAEYIGQSGSLQLSTAEMIGAVETSTIDGLTATATVTNNTIVTGERILESTLHITVAEASVVTCMGGEDGGEKSIEFSITAVPEVPQRISAREISRPLDSICIILVTWDPPTNSDASDIDQYIVYVPSRNIRDDIFSSTIFLSTLMVPNCGDDVRVQVAAVNSVGCVGLNSSEVQPLLLDIRTATIEGGSTTMTAVTEDRSASNQLTTGDVVGITIGVVLILCISIAITIIGIYIIYIRYYPKQGPRVPMNANADDSTDTEKESDVMGLISSNLQLQKELKELRGSNPKECLLDLYIALRTQSQKKSINATVEETSYSVITSAMVALRAVLKKTEAFEIKEALMNSLEELKSEKHIDGIQRALDYLMELIPDTSTIDDECKSNIEELRDRAKLSSEKTSLQNALDNMMDKVLDTAPNETKRILLTFCDAIFEKILKLSYQQEKVVRAFEISLKSLKEVEELLTAEFMRGLESEEEDINVKMFVTHIHEMPKGTEEGEFLVMDLGVNHLRVQHINIVKGRIKKQGSKEFYINEDTKNSSSCNNLFNFIVNCIAKFIKDRNIRKNLPIGFTFPFPMKHESLTCGKLVRWTRDFKGYGAKGMDIVQLLKEAASRRQKPMKVNVVALINDTTGILLSVGNEVPDCRIGLALGDGANACYIEELSAIPKFKGDHKHVIINTEWGAFGDDGKLEASKHGDQWRTEYDRQLDDKSSNPREQLFGKMISDKYQGIIVYLVLKDLISKEALFQGKSSPIFDQLGTFSTRKLSTMEGWDLDNCKKLFKDRFNIEASDKDCEVIRRVCVAVSTRAARLTAAGVVALVKKIKMTDGCTVAVDGSLYKRDGFPERMSDALNELAPRSNIKMKLTENGSSLGAAFAAAMNYAYVGSPPSCSSTPRSSSSVGSAGRPELTHANIDTRPQHGEIELTEIGTKN